MHENKIFFLRGNLFKIFKIFWIFFKFVFENISEQIRYFNTGFVSYSVSIQPNITQNW
jgi:hypothetical protein